MRASIVKALSSRARFLGERRRESQGRRESSRARFLEERRRERVSVGSGLLAHISWRKDVEVRVKGVLWKVNSGKEGLFRRKDVEVRVKGGHWRKSTQGKGVNSSTES